MHAAQNEAFDSFELLDVKVARRTGLSPTGQREVRLELERGGLLSGGASVAAGRREPTRDKCNSDAVLPLGFPLDTNSTTLVLFIRASMT